MNDRFSMRAFDKEKKVMYQAAFIDFYRIVCYEKVEDMGMYINFSNSQEYMLDDENLVLIQCTGLKDKNGQLIYEGDIVKHRDSNPVIFIVSVEFDYFGWECRFRYRSDGKIVTGFPDKDQWEIIGNIYQHPELVKETKDEN
ncbi:MAG: YopX family protein [Candidatus Cloacimonetes bacterium]|nr:YopX family protein [Candidatus Cloacimonadota bacterium]